MYVKANLVANVTFLSFSAKLLNFVFLVLITRSFGADYRLDAYFIAIFFAQQFMIGVTTISDISFIPNYIELKLKKGNTESQDFAHSVIFTFLCVAGAFLLCCIIFTGPLISFMAQGFSSKALLLTKELTRISFLYCLIMVVVTLFSAILNAEKKFLFVATIPLVTLFFQFISLLLFKKSIGIISLALGLLIGGVFTLVFQIIIMKKLKFDFKVQIKKEYIFSLIKQIHPLTYGIIVALLVQLIDKYLAAGMETGTVSRLNIAYTFTQLNLLVSVSFSTILYPFSGEYFHQNFEKYRSLLTNSLSMLLYLLLPFSFILLIFGKDFIELIYQKGLFTAQDTLLTSKALLFYSPITVSSGMIAVILRFYFVQKRILATQVLSVISFILYIFIVFPLCRYFNYIGLAISMSISSVFLVLLLIWGMRKEIGRENLIYIFRRFIEVVLVVCVAFYSLEYFTSKFSVCRVSFIIKLAFGMLIYLGLCHLMNIQEQKQVLNYCKNRIQVVFEKLGRAI